QVPDTTAPSTSIATPANGATVSGTASVTASASDDVAVTSVEFYLDGALVATDNAAPYAWSWNTTTAANGTHALLSKAYDAAGNSASSSTVTVTVSNSAADTTAPIISNVASRKTSTTAFEITWTTNEPSTSVVVLNGTTYTDTALVTSHRRAFTGKRNTAYTYTVRSADAAGNIAQAGPFTHQN
ncbi:MAG: hypothetical protein QOH21_108, partial [Acidobacteriota bacterium]|nr:hypothetical protein [Acidobacteriota bacterium]